jgi:hypothetical protein
VYFLINCYNKLFNGKYFFCYSHWTFVRGQADDIIILFFMLIELWFENSFSSGIEVLLGFNFGIKEVLNVSLMKLSKVEVCLDFPTSFTSFMFYDLTPAWKLLFEQFIFANDDIFFAARMTQKMLSKKNGKFFPISKI